jgi:hypothetical protein
MPLNSCQLYIHSMLDGLIIPGAAQPLQAYITPPNIEDLDGPRAYVWGGRLRGKRQAGPRGPGFKHLQWTIDVYLSYLTVPDGANIDQEFPLIVDAIMAATWATKMPLVITDPTTQVMSQIQSIGEDFDLEYPPERNPATLRMLYYTCRVGLDVFEVVQA